MAILDTFYTLFKTNADEAKKGFDDAEKSAVGFGASLSRVDEGVHAAGERIVETFVEIGGAIAAAFAFEHIKSFIEDTIHVNAALGGTSERIGVAVEDLAALQSAATRFGGSADGATASLDFLNRGMADIAVKGTSRLKPFFDELKINPLDAAKHVKPLLEVYGELADRLGKMTAQERAGYGEKFGIDQGLLLSLAEGRRGFEDIIQRQKELGVTTTADAEAADKFEKKLDDVRVVIHHMGTEIVSGLLPFLGKMVDGFMEFVGFLQHHKPLVEGFFIGLGGIIAAFYTRAVVNAAIATAVWLAEVLLIPTLIAAAIAALAFLYDDVQNFLAGNKSVIGELTKQWPIVGEVVREVAKDISAAWQWIIGVIRGGGDAIRGVINLTVAILARLGTVAGDIGRAIGAVFKKEFPDVVELIENVAGALAGLIGWLIKGVEWFAKFGLSAVAALPKALAKSSEYLNSAAVSVNGPRLALGGTAPTLAHRDEIERARISALYDRRPGAPVPPARFAAAHAPAPLPARLAPPAPVQADHRPGSPAPVQAGQGDSRAPVVEIVRQVARAAPHPADTAEGVRRGKDQVATATATPLAALGNSTHNSQHITKHVNVTVENVTIQTQASDPQAVAGAVGDHLTDHIRKAINAHDDGVAM